MRALKTLLVACLMAAWSLPVGADTGFESVDFPTSDGIQARADLYGGSESSSPLILSFHQAGWSRGEYREIAPKLVADGYRMLAVDQRSGRGVNRVTNETHTRAAKKRLSTRYLDAYADLVAALRYARDVLGASKVVVWGSSYSASLVVRLAVEHPAEVSAVLAFSPGEYFKKDKDYVAGFAKQVTQPLFITSSKAERAQVEPLYQAAPTDKKILFTPASKGQHGSRALWSRFPDHDVYWAAVRGFLTTYAPAK